jgi:hypothetical protein
MGWSSALQRKVMAAVAPTGFIRPKVIPFPVDWAHVVTIDFETYYDQDYTLSKLSTSEYIRDPRFKAHMMGVKIGNRKTKVVPAKNIASELRKIDWTCHDLLCHNTAFDGFILSHIYGVIPRRFYDTLSMARGLHSNDIGASLDEVAQFYGVGNKVPNVLEQTKGVRDLPKGLYKQTSEYCGVDVDLCFDIFKMMVPAFPDSEMRLVDLTIRMFCEPVLRVDIPRVEAELARELKEREDLLLSVPIAGFDEKKLKPAERELTGNERHFLIAKKIVGSNEQFADLLRQEGVTPPVKISPAWIKKPKDERDDSKKWAYAFAKDDQDFIELPGRTEEWTADLNLNRAADIKKMAQRQLRIQALVDVRLAVKSTTNITRAERFLTAGADNMPLPVGYAYARAHTLRWGGNNKMNMQNLKRGGELRQAIQAPKGHVICVADSGQIEARVNGWLWGQDDLMQAFRTADKWDKKTMGVARGDNRDAYCRFADFVYGREITTEDSMERFVGKVCVLGLGFQMGADKFQATLAKGALGGPPVFFDLNKCKMIVNTYRNKNYKIQQGWKICSNIIEDMAAGREGSYKCLHWEKERIWLPNGMCLKYPNLKKKYNEEKGWDEWTYESKGNTKKIYGGLLCENIVQCLARLIVAEQMLIIAKLRRVVMITHDEIVAIARKAAANACFNEMMKAMKKAPTWCPDIPLNCEGGYAENYSK